MDPDKLVRRTGYLAVFAVSAIAALLSYWHAVYVVGEHGEPGVYGHLYPITIDGLIVAASMVLLDAARHRAKAPRLAWALVISGILATLGANMLDGISHGFLGCIIAAWPAAAFIGAYEMIMVLIRSASERAAGKPETPSPQDSTSQLPWPDTPEFRAEFDPTVRMHTISGSVNGNGTKPSEETATQAEEVVPEPEPVADPEPPAKLEQPAEPQQPAGQNWPEWVTSTDTRTDTASLGPVGSVNVRSPFGRAERKIPVDERVATRSTGTFPAIQEPA